MGKTGIITCSVNVWDFLTGVSNNALGCKQVLSKKQTIKQNRCPRAISCCMKFLILKKLWKWNAKSWYQASRLRVKLALAKREVRFIILFKGGNLTRTKLNSFGTKIFTEFVIVLQTLYSESCNEKSFSAKSRKWSSHQICVKTRFSSRVWAIKT